MTPLILLVDKTASIYASTAAKSYILNYIWTAANFIIEGRMRPSGRRLCTVVLTLRSLQFWKWVQCSVTA